MVSEKNYGTSNHTFGTVFLLKIFYRVISMQKWVELFYENPPMIKLHPVFFLRGNQYLMEALFYTQNDDKFLSAINKFQDTYNSNDFPKDDNIESLGFLYLYSNKFNLCFIKVILKRLMLLLMML